MILFDSETQFVFVFLCVFVFLLQKLEPVPIRQTVSVKHTLSASRGVQQCIVNAKHPSRLHHHHHHEREKNEIMGAEKEMKIMAAEKEKKIMGAEKEKKIMGAEK